jgi:uncharacterized membrane protein
MGHNGGNWLTDTLSNRPLIVGALFLGTYFAPFLILIGLALAYVFKRDPEEEWEMSHFQYLIRTFWIVILGTVIALVLAVISVFAIEYFEAALDYDSPFLGALAVLAIVMVPLLVFSGVRIVISLMNSAAHRPMPNPKTWLL